MNVNNIGYAPGFGLGPETIAGQNPKKFNLSYQKYQGYWITQDFRLGGTHVMTRVKSFTIFLDFLRGATNTPIGYPFRDNLEKEHYKINLHDPLDIREIEYERFDYDIIKPNISPFADALVNEMWPFFRMLWRTRGGYDAEVWYNPDIDLKEFGSNFGPGMYTAYFKFSINKQGEWSADFTYDFQQVDNIFDDREPPPRGRKGPFYAQDYSRIQSNTAKRARKIAKPDWSTDTGRSDSEFAALLDEEEFLNKMVDFSFSYSYQGTGHWGDIDKYKVDVPNVMKSESIIETPTAENLVSVKSIKRSNG